MRQFFGLVLVVVGGLWLALSGLCTAGFGVAFMQQGQFSDIWPVLLIGIPSLVIGYVLFAFGRWLRNQP